MEDLKDFLLMIFGVVLFIVVGLGIIFGIGATAYALTEPHSCAAKAQALGLQHTWGFWQGCYVKTSEGENLPLETYLDRTVTQNVRIR